MSTSFRRLTQVEMVSGNSRMVAYVPSGRAFVGNKAEVKGEEWVIVSAYLTDSSQYVAWFVPFGVLAV